MLKTSKDFNTAITQLTQGQSIDFSGVGRLMKSDEFNSTMKQIEYDLDALYEDIRMLNDIAEYCHTYVINSVEEKRAKFIEQLKVIEQLTDSYQDKSHVTQLVPFTINQEIITNRQGQAVKSMNINSGALEMAGEKAEEASIQSAMKISSFGSSSSTPEQLVVNKPSRSTYLLDEPAVSGIEEEYEIRFKRAICANYIDIDTSNCDMANLSVINESDETIPINAAGAFVTAKDISGLRFKLNSREYSNSINANSYSNTKTLLPTANGYHNNKQDFSKDEKRLSDEERLNQMGLYRGAYAAWAKESEAVDKKNALSSNQTAMSYSTTNGSRSFSENAITLPDGSVLDEFSSTGYEYVPSGEVTAEALIASGNYESAPTPAFSDIANGIAKHGYTYSFGIDNITVQNRSMYDECGFVSDVIEIGSCSYIELNTKEVGTNLVEYYIVDGTKTAAILPVDVEKINGELLRYEVDTRFTIDTSKSVTIDMDGKTTDLTLADKDSFDFISHTYTISYTPANGKKYFPDNESIQIKALQKASETPTTIQAISINKHGGESDWTILD